ncbi:MAG TPA: hypothetical protein VFD70_03840, partial [Anaerolineae bacterium]|nr:hypothetical protein [Anaerolineae bacterium]
PGDMSEAWFASDRKNFLSELFNALMLRVETGSVHSSALAQALWRGLREKSVQMYFNDDEAEQAVLDANWGGAVNPGVGDSLFIVDSNVGFNKVNARVTRAITYSVNLNTNTASVEITYANPSVATNDACNLIHQHKDNTYASMEQSCYWNYVRILAPAGSHFLSAQGVTDAGDADDIGTVAAFGGYAIIPRAATRAVRFDYTLPRSILHADTYWLHVQQQAGLAATPITVRVELPHELQLQSATHDYTWRDASTIEIYEMLDRDIDITLYFNAALKGSQP